MNAKQQPLISIIMPTHNTERFIQAAIESVLAQTYSRWELWVIDDASTDNTAEIVQQFHDDRIHYHRTDRVGSPSGVRNIGLKLAQGEFIAFLDADDLFYPNTLEKLLTPLLEDSSKTAIYGFANNMNEQEQPIANFDVLIPKVHKGFSLPPDYRHTWSNFVQGKISCLLAGLMIRISTLKRVGLFNEDLYAGEDFQFYMRLFLDNFQGVYCLPDYVYRYRIYATSLTKSPEHADRVMESGLKIMDWLYTQANLPADVYRVKAKAYASCYHYYIRERLLNEQPGLARRIALSAFKNPNLPFFSYLWTIGPLFLRSLLPVKFSNFLVVVRWKLRRAYQKLVHQEPHP